MFGVAGKQDNNVLFCEARKKKRKKDVSLISGFNFNDNDDHLLEKSI